MKIRTLVNANEALKKYMPVVKQTTGKDITLDRMRLLMEHIGNPHTKLKIIHIAGTSGKTSTAYYAASLLTNMGFKTGLSVSPHIDSVTERIQLQGKPISDTDFCKHLEEFLHLVDTSPIEPSYFELLMAFAYWVFSKKDVDVAVIETGLGGLHDGSNVAQNKDKICVITDIGFDHMHVLGNTLTEIAAQKAGIIHEGNVVCMYKQQHAIMQSVRDRVVLKNAEIYIVSEDTTVAPTLPAYQQRNFNLALQTVNLFLKLYKLSCNKKAILQAISTYIPGRMDVLAIQNKTVIFDGAHNQQKMHALVDTLRKRYPNKKFAVLLAMKNGKEFTDVLNELKPIVGTLLITEFTIYKDVPMASQNASFIQQYARDVGITSQVITDTTDAFNALLAYNDNVVIVTGSLYLISQIRNNILHVN